MNRKWNRITQMCTYTQSHKHTAPQHNECVPVFIFIYTIYKANCSQPYLAVKKNVLPHSWSFGHTNSIGQTMEWWWWCWGVRRANTEHKCAKSYSIPLRCICGSFACRFFHFAIIYLFFRINNPLGFALTLWYTFLFYFALAGGASASVAAAANLLTPWTHREYKTKESIL